MSELGYCHSQPTGDKGLGRGLWRLWPIAGRLTEHRRMIDTLLSKLSVLALITFATSVFNGCASAQAVRGTPAEAAGPMSCTEELRQYATADRGHIEQELNEQASRFQLQAERAFAHRAKTIAFYRDLERTLELGKPLTGEQLHVLNRGMSEHLRIRRDLLGIAHRHECWVDLGDDELKRYGLSVETQFKGVMTSLAAALVLYDNYLLAVSIFEENPKLRQLINAKDSGYQIGRNELYKVSLSYASVDNRRRTRNAIKLYERRKEALGEAMARDPYLPYMALIIEQSPSYSMTRKWSPGFVIGKGLDLFARVTTDVLTGLGKEGVSLFSMVFGNSVGLIETRKGKLYDNAAVRKTVSSALLPGDILLEKTPFRLTDKFIPGHWGHVAIWVGTEQQLRELGLWQHPLVAPYQERIRQGHGVIEALRSGVELSTLPRFMNVDDLAVIRSSDPAPSHQARIVLQALRQIDKDYDFNFDVETTDKIVCSELVYHVYTGYRWPTSKTLGRSTISPDHIAAKVLEDKGLELILLYHDGKPVRKLPMARMAGLMDRTVLSSR